MREGHTTHGFPVFGIAVAGLVLGHLATYAVLYPDPDHRGLELASTGHAYLPALAHLACVLAAAAAASVVGRAWGGRGRGTAATLAGLAGALAITQACAFVGQEILERVLSGSPLHELFASPLLVLGVAAQVTLAVAGAAIVMWLRRTTQRLASVAPSAPHGRTWRPGALVVAGSAELGSPTPTFVGVRPGRSPPSV